MLAKSPRQVFLEKKNVSLPLGLGMMLFYTAFICPTHKFSFNDITKNGFPERNFEKWIKQKGRTCLTVC